MPGILCKPSGRGSICAGRRYRACCVAYRTLPLVWLAMDGIFFLPWAFWAVVFLRDLPAGLCHLSLWSPCSLSVPVEEGGREERRGCSLLLLIPTPYARFHGEKQTIATYSFTAYALLVFFAFIVTAIFCCRYGAGTVGRFCGLAWMVDLDSVPPARCWVLTSPVTALRAEPLLNNLPSGGLRTLLYTAAGMPGAKDALSGLYTSLWFSVAGNVCVGCAIFWTHIACSANCALNIAVYPCRALLSAPLPLFHAGWRVCWRCHHNNWTPLRA